MATRRETEEQRRKVEASLRESLRSGPLRPGDRVPSVREIAAQHNVSAYIAHQALQALSREGLFQGTPGRGTVVGRAASSGGASQSPRFGFVVDRTPQEAEMIAPTAQMQVGFEDRIAQLGGTMVLAHWESLLGWGDQMPLAGMFLLTGQPYNEAFEAGGLLHGTARVRFAAHTREYRAPEMGQGLGEELGCAYDLVSADDRDGGRQASEHLIECGHKRIAFLGLHAQSSDSIVGWSVERAEGWRAALDKAGLLSESLLFLPSREVEDHSQVLEAAHDASGHLARRIAEGEEISGVVAANDRAALALLGQLQKSHVERERWPSIVGFDNSAPAAAQNITSLRVPWEEIGRAAADVAWARSLGTASARSCGVVHQKVAMRLIPRLTCHFDWARSFPFVSALEPARAVESARAIASASST